MESRFKDDEHWAAIATELPQELELWVRETKALVRDRNIRDGETLVRLALVYASGLSYRQTALWAAANEVAFVSDVALLKRLRKLEATLERLVYSLLPPPQTGPTVFVMDASSICRPTAKGTDFLLNLSWDASRIRIDDLVVTGPKPRESFRNLPLRRGCVYMGDRGYGYRPGVAAVYQAGADSLVRISLNSLPMQTLEGSRVNLLECARTLNVGEVLDLDCAVVPNVKQGIPTIGGRLIIVKREPDIAQRERARRKAEAKKKGQTVKAATGEAADYLFLFTTLERPDASAQAVLEAYRHRWQIEMLFKRLKSVVGLDQVQARDPTLARVTILAKLLAILLIQKIQGDFSPWGYGMPRRTKPLASS